MTTYTIPNIRPEMETGTMVVFYTLSNGESLTNRIPITTPVAEIQKWGEEKCKWFDEREVILEELQNQLVDNPLDILNEPIGV